MYLDYFGFDEPPFSITPDPQFVFLSKKHQESLAHLLYGVTRGGGAGFVQLTGEVGTGKTTISRLLLEQIPEKTNIALILNPNIKPIELLKNICHELKIDIDSSTLELNALIDQLNNYLLESWSSGENTVVIIDEAQNLPRDTLEQLRLLTNLETDKQKLLQIILIGQPELRSTMRRNDLRQLAQRVTARYHLMPLSSEETREYLHHRIKVAGGNVGMITNSVSRLIHKLTGGVPRLINTLTDRALLSAYTQDSRYIQAKHINLAAKEVLPETINHTSVNTKTAVKSLTIWALCLLLLVSAVMAVIYAFDRGYVQSVISQGHREQADKTQMNSNNTSVDSLSFLPASTTQAWHTYLQLWGSQYHESWGEANCPERHDIAMACLRRQGNLKQIEKINHPVLLQMQEGTLVLLAGIDGDMISLLNQNLDYTVVSKHWVDDQWLGTYFIIWPMPAKLLLDATVSDMQEWSLEMANTIDEKTINAQQLKQWVIKFQSQQGLLADGIIGPETQMALSLMAYSGPLLKQ